MSSMPNAVASDDAGHPWWSFGHLWMVMAGPAIVVVAACFTFYLAASDPDPVLNTQDVPESQSAKTVQLTQVPALEARNHAATGAAPVKPDVRP